MNPDFWGPYPHSAAHVEGWIENVNWDYILTIRQPRPASDNWCQPFATAIDSLDLFPCRRRYTSEPPGWMPIRYRDKGGTDALTVFVAVPPGALRLGLAAYDIVKVVLEQAAKNAFINPEVRIRFATPSQIEGLLDSTEPATIEFATAFVREHHAKC